MIERSHLAALTPTQRAELIYRQARGELAQGLWRAALGDREDSGDRAPSWTQPATKPGELDALLILARSDGPHPLREAPTQAPSEAVDVEAAPSDNGRADPQLRVEALGPNARFAGAIARASERTGLPAAALASIIDAEAARREDGAWNVHSRNPRSSAAGLGQFLSGTWEGEAERPGTWLNVEARRRGWLDPAGQVTGEARGMLLALRYDPEASIQAIADYADGNLRQLRRAGVKLGGDVESIARAAYLGHHLGSGDAARFLKGGLDSARAERLLAAQVGQGAAARRVAEAGNASDAHRQWLTGYVGRRINPARFT